MYQGKVGNKKINSLLLQLDTKKSNYDGENCSFSKILYFILLVKLGKFTHSTFNRSLIKKRNK